MTRKTYNLIVRFIAGLSASLILVGCNGILSDRAAANRPQKIVEEMTAQSLLQKASGIDQDAIVMTIDGEPVTVAEYLFWMTYLGNEMTHYYEITDFSSLMSDSITAGDYVKTLATSYVTNYAVVRQWANELQLTLSASDISQMDEERQEAIKSYGSEEIYAEQLSLLGYTEDLLYDVILPYSLLRSHIEEEYIHGSLRPTDAVLADFAEEKSLCMGKLLSVCAEDFASADEAEAKMNEYLETLKTSETLDAAWDSIAAELSMDTSPMLFDMSGSNPISSGIAALEIDGISEVIPYEDDYFILQRAKHDYDTLASAKFDTDLELRCANATIAYTDIYEQLDMNTYYPAFLTAQAELQAAITARESVATENNG